MSCCDAFWRWVKERKIESSKTNGILSNCMNRTQNNFHAKSSSMTWTIKFIFTIDWLLTRFCTKYNHHFPLSFHVPHYSETTNIASILIQIRDRVSSQSLVTIKSCTWSSWERRALKNSKQMCICEFENEIQPIQTQRKTYDQMGCGERI